MMNIRMIYLFLASNIEAREAFDKQLKAGELVDVAAIAKKGYAQEIAETKATIEECEQGMIPAAPNYRPSTNSRSRRGGAIFKGIKRMCKLLALGFAMLAGLFYYSGAVELGNLFLAALFFITILYIIVIKAVERQGDVKRVRKVRQTIAR